MSDATLLPTFDDKMVAAEDITPAEPPMPEPDMTLDTTDVTAYEDVYNARIGYDPIGGGPQYGGTSLSSTLASALVRAPNMGRFIAENVKEGFLNSFGLGTLIREMSLPPRATEDAPEVSPGQAKFNRLMDTFLDRGEPGKKITQDEYRKSPWYRDNVPYDEGMTEERARALSEWNDEREFREELISRRTGVGSKVIGFVSQMAGAATDPVNYIPAFGPAARAYAIAKWGQKAGRAVTFGTDAAINTTVAGALTADARRRLGDDVSWQGDITNIAMSALIGAAFGGLTGRFAQVRERRSANRMETVFRAREQLDQAVGDIVQGRPVNVDVAPVVEMQAQPPRQGIRAYHGSPYEFDRFDSSKIGTGEGAQAFGRGLYFAENPSVAESYRGGALEIVERPDGYMGGPRRFDIVNGIDGVVQDTFPTREAAEAAIGRGHFYEVTIDARQEELIDWDKPLEEQSDFVRSRIDTKTGTIEDFIKSREDDVSPDYIASILSARGIKGIRFLDAGSRDRGAGTANYVVFDDKLVSVITRDGQQINSTIAEDTPADPQAITEAAARVSKPVKDIAEDVGVDPESGEFAEMDEFDQLVKAGRLSAEEVKAFAAANENLARANEYAEGLKAAAACRMI